MGNFSMSIFSPSNALRAIKTNALVTNALLTNALITNALRTNTLRAGVVFGLNGRRSTCAYM